MVGLQACWFKIAGLLKVMGGIFVWVGVFCLESGLDVADFRCCVVGVWRIKRHLGFGEYRVRRWQAIEKYILTVWIVYMIALSESPPSVEGVLVTLEEHQHALAWQILHITMKEHLLAKLILLKVVLGHLLIPFCSENRSTSVLPACLISYCSTVA